LVGNTQRTIVQGGEMVEERIETMAFRLLARW
jgi:hypothetical protein